MSDTANAIPYRELVPYQDRLVADQSKLDRHKSFMIDLPDYDSGWTKEIDKLSDWISRVSGDDGPTHGLPYCKLRHLVDKPVEEENGRFSWQWWQPLTDYRELAWAEGLAVIDTASTYFTYPALDFVELPDGLGLIRAPAVLVNSAGVWVAHSHAESVVKRAEAHVPLGEWWYGRGPKRVRFSDPLTLMLRRPLALTASEMVKTVEWLQAVRDADPLSPIWLPPVTPSPLSGYKITQRSLVAELKRRRAKMEAKDVE